MIHITDTTVFDEREISERAVRAPGPGGKNLNRAAAAVELRLDIDRSSLPPDVKRRLIAQGRGHLTANGVFVVVGRSGRSPATNRDAALGQLLRFLMRASLAPTERQPAAVRQAGRRRRLVSKGRTSGR